MVQNVALIIRLPWYNDDAKRCRSDANGESTLKERRSNEIRIDRSHLFPH